MYTRVDNSVPEKSATRTSAGRVETTSTFLGSFGECPYHLIAKKLVPTLVTGDYNVESSMETVFFVWIAINQDFREIAVAASFALIAGFFGLWNALIEMEVLDLVNATLPPEKQYPTFGRSYPYFDVRRDYKVLFPGGDLVRKSDKVKIAALCIFLAGFVLQSLANRIWP